MKRTLPLLASVLALSAALVGCSREEEAPAPAHPAPVDANHTYDGVRIHGAELGEWSHDWEAAIALGRSAKRPVLAVFTASDWNAWHRFFAAHVLETPVWKEWVGRRLVLAWVNHPNDADLVPAEYAARNRDLTRQYGANAFPAVFLVNPSTRQVYSRYRITSDTSAEEFIAWVQRTAMDSQPGGVKFFLPPEDIAALEALRAERDPLKKAYDDAVLADNQELEAMRARKTPTAEIAAWAEASDARLAALKAPVAAIDRKIDVYYARAFEKRMADESAE